MTADAVSAQPLAAARRTGRGDLLRRVTLFLAMLLSGGLLIFPRLPILLLVLVLCLFIPGFRLVLRRGMVPIVALFGAVVLVTLLRPGPLDLESLAVRIGNFVNFCSILRRCPGRFSEMGHAPAHRVVHRLGVILGIDCRQLRQ